MKISRLALKNWRCFSSINVTLGSRLIITGPCGAGKSSFLDSLCFLQELATGAGLEAAVGKRGGLSRLRNLEARFPETDVTLEVHLEERKKTGWVYRLKFGEEQGRVAIKEEMVWRSSALIMRRPDAEDQKYPGRKRESGLDPRLSPESIQSLVNFFRLIRYENPDPQLLRVRDFSSALKKHGHGKDFFDRLALTPEKTRRVRLRHIGQALQLINPASGELKATRDALGHWHLWLSCRHWRPRGSWQDESYLPDGLLRLVVIWWSIFEGKEPLLVEEPEIGLHPEAVSLLPRLMQKFVRLSHRPPQLILTSHAPALWSDRLVKPGEILLLVPSRRGTRIIRGADKEMIKRFLEAGSTMKEEIKHWLGAEEEPMLPLF